MDAMSDDFELLDLHHDVLSLSETDTSEGCDNDSGAAAAVIEAMEEPAHANLQGLALGALPHFLTGLYGATPPAAGQTYTVDLGTSPVSSPVADGAERLHSSVPAPEDTPFISLLPQQAAAAAAPAGQVAQQVQDPPMTAAVTATATKAADDVCRIDRAPQMAASTCPTAGSNNKPMLICLLSAAALATLLLLLGIAAGSSSHQQREYPDPSLFPAPGYHTTSIEGYSTSGNNLHSGQGSARLGVMPWARAPMAGRAGPAAVHCRQHSVSQPWLVLFNTSNAVRLDKQGRGGLPLPLLPAILQHVIERSARANMSSSQRLRLHLWLLHCAARDAGSTCGHTQSQAGVQLPSSRPAANSNVQTRGRRARPAVSSRRPAPTGPRCAGPHSFHTWVPPSPPKCTASPSAQHSNVTAAATSLAAARVTAAVHLGTYLNSSAGQPDSKEFDMGQCWAIHPLSSYWVIKLLREGGPGVGGVQSLNSSRDDDHISAPEGLAAPPPASSFTRPATVTLLDVPPKAQQCSALTKRLAAPSQALASPAAPAAAAAAGSSHFSRVVVQPTKPIPPLYRPPLPCLLIGIRRLNTTTIRRQALHGTARHSMATPAPNRPNTWPNISTRACHFVRHRAMLTPWGAKPYTRAFALSFARWGLRQVQHGVSGPLSLPMLPPVAAAAPTANSTHEDKTPSVVAAAGAAAAAEGHGSVGGGLTLPMLPPVCRPPAAVAAVVAVQQEQIAQQASSGLSAALSSSDHSSSSGTADWLTLPMLPPVTSPCASSLSHTFGGLTWPMLPPVPSSVKPQHTPASTAAGDIGSAGQMFQQQPSKTSGASARLLMRPHKVAAAIPLLPALTGVVRTASQHKQPAVQPAASAGIELYGCVNNRTLEAAVAVAARRADVQAGRPISSSVSKAMTQQECLSCAASYEALLGASHVGHTAEAEAVSATTDISTSRTGWVASLITLPMLPPTTDESSAGAAVHDASSVDDVHVVEHISGRTHDRSVQYNVTFVSFGIPY